MSRPVAEVSIKGRRGTIPDWTLRIALVFASYGLLWVLATDGVPPGVLVVLGLIALAGVAVPASPAAAVLGGGAAIILAVFSDGDPVRPAVLASIVLVHLVHVLSALVAVLPMRSRVHLSALRGPALRFLGIQVVVFALAALAWQLPRSPTPVLVEVAALLAVTGVAVLVLVQLRRR